MNSKNEIRKRVKEGENYFCLGTIGESKQEIDYKLFTPRTRFDYGNYYLSSEGAKAVAKLREHVYKCGPVIAGKDYLKIDDDFQYGLIGGENTVISYYGFDVLPEGCLEHIEERIRLIKECQKLNKFVTI